MYELPIILFLSGNERAIILFLLFESAVLVMLAGLVRFCCIFWRKKKVQGQDLGSFLEKRVSLNPYIFAEIKLDSGVREMSIISLAIYTREGHSVLFTVVKEAYFLLVSSKSISLFIFL